ncbi:unnamed protein product [Hermetia illucens]|uniref:Uncharacterized protein n=1 Tax=Hermetia illucens TaxID=343691 RepID=A0A7R8UVF0_HERIL|nr:unnamed protein product [Hermetia illucens]
MTGFTGTNEVSLNAFISSTEYYLNSINDEEIRKAATRQIYFEKIQGAAKDAIINIPAPDDWELIKSNLKLRFKPDMEPADIYRKINSLRINTLCLKFKTKNIVSEIKVKQSTELPSPVPTSSSSSKSDPEPPTSIPTSDPRSATTKVRFNDIRFF